MPGEEPGVEKKGPVAAFQPFSGTLRSGKLAARRYFGTSHSVSARQAHDGRPDEQLYLSTLPMIGRPPCRDAAAQSTMRKPK